MSVTSVTQTVQHLLTLNTPTVEYGDFFRFTLFCLSGSCSQLNSAKHPNSDLIC